jgi:hypothetical protein
MTTFPEQAKLEFEELEEKEKQLKHDLDAVTKQKKPLKDYLSGIGILETDTKKKGRPRQ